MICPGCDRDNDPRRRYCGKCGFNFEPVCRRCNYTNEGDDRFCGGCGSLLVAKEGCHVRRVPTPSPALVRQNDDVAVISSAPIMAEGSSSMRASTARPPSAPPPAPVPVIFRPALVPVPAPVPVGAQLANELAGLFSPTVLPGKAGPLPDAGIEQGDLDKLFGGTP